jgi:hypothetical protein
MFGEDHHESINQRGIDEALACQDMLARAPTRPNVFTQVLARLSAAVRSWAPRTRKRTSRIAIGAPLKVSRSFHVDLSR